MVRLLQLQLVSGTYRIKSSEFGVTRESTAWRPRGPPMARKLRPGRSICQFFPSLLVLRFMEAAFFRTLLAHIALGAIAGLSRPLLTSGNMLLCFVPHVQPGAGTALLGDWLL
jgi:hypothetical protein